MENHHLINAAADRIESALIAIPGARVSFGASDKSLSRYVTVYFEYNDDPEYGPEVTGDFKIRISDHDIPSYYSQSNYDVTVGGCGADTNYVLRREDELDDLVAAVVARAVQHRDSEIAENA